MLRFELVSSVSNAHGTVDVYERFLVATMNSYASMGFDAASFLGWIGDISDEAFAEPWGYIGALLQW